MNPDEVKTDEVLSLFDLPDLEDTCRSPSSESADAIVLPVDKRRVPEGERKYEITELHNRHREIARLAALGLPQKRIAEELGCTPQTVSNTLNSAITKRHMERLHGLRDQSVVDSGARLAELSPIAVEELRKGFNEDSGLSPNQRVSLAQDILDRTNHGRTTSFHQQVTHTHMTLDDIAEITALANAQALNAGAISIEGTVI